MPAPGATASAKASAFAKPRKRAVAENTRLAAAAPVFKSAVGLARGGGNKTRLARERVLHGTWKRRGSPASVLQNYEKLPERC